MPRLTASGLSVFGRHSISPFSGLAAGDMIYRLSIHAAFHLFKVAKISQIKQGGLACVPAISSKRKQRLVHPVDDAHHNGGREERD
jgi:hypothetical protein